MYWVIEYLKSCPCWIQEQGPLTFGVTYQLKFAHKFVSSEDARNEILRIGLSGDWGPVHYGGRSE